MVLLPQALSSILDWRNFQTNKGDSGGTPAARSPRPARTCPQPSKQPYCPLVSITTKISKSRVASSRSRPQMHGTTLKMRANAKQTFPHGAATSDSGSISSSRASTPPSAPRMPSGSAGRMPPGPRSSSAPPQGSQVPNARSKMATITLLRPFTCLLEE